MCSPARGALHLTTRVPAALASAPLWVFEELAHLDKGTHLATGAGSMSGTKILSEGAYRRAYVPRSL